MFQSVLWRAVVYPLLVFTLLYSRTAQYIAVRVHIHFVTSCICRSAALCICCMCNASNCIAFSCHADANVICVDLGGRRIIKKRGKKSPRPRTAVTHSTANILFCNALTREVSCAASGITTIRRSLCLNSSI